MVIFLALYVLCGLIFGWLYVRGSKGKEFRHEISTLIFALSPGLLAVPVFIIFWPLILALDYVAYRLGHCESLQKKTTVAVQRDQELPEGTTGVCLTDLKPSGKIRVGENAYDATATDKFIERGTEVRIVGKQGFAFIVEPTR